MLEREICSYTIRTDFVGGQKRSEQKVPAEAAALDAFPHSIVPTYYASLHFLTSPPISRILQNGAESSMVFFKSRRKACTPKSCHQNSGSEWVWPAQKFWSIARARRRRGGVIMITPPPPRSTIPYPTGGFFLPSRY